MMMLNNLNLAYKLVYNQLIVAQVAAINSIGMSNYSLPNTEGVLL